MIGWVRNGIAGCRRIFHGPSGSGARASGSDWVAGVARLGPTRLVRYDVPGRVHFWTISCYRRLAFFWHDAVKQIVVDGLAVLRQRFGICLIGYVVMPEHVHVLLYPHARNTDAPAPISTLLHAFKRHVGYHGKEALRGVWRRDGRLWSDVLNQWATGRFDSQTVWAARGYDFNIDRVEALREKLDYGHKNPITRGFVERAADWRWSSFRFYELEDASLLAMDWDGRGPMIW